MAKTATNKPATPPADPGTGAGEEQQAQGQAQEQTQAEEQKAPPKPPSRAPAPQAGPLKVCQERNGKQSDPKALALLKHVCEVFGVNPSVEQRPIELLAWTFYPGDIVHQIPDAVSVMTAGGQKLKLYADDTLEDDTVQALARIFGLKPLPEGKPFTTDALPDDLTLPPVMVHGLSTSQEHVFKKGYLREGGKTEAARRQALKKKADQ